MRRGKIYKILSNNYYIKSDNELFECKARGKFKIDGIDLCVGDDVEFDDEKKLVLKVLERKNVLLRPNIANIDKLLILVSIKDPAPDLLLLDKEIIYCIKNNIEPIICISKIDKDKEDKCEEIIDIYSKTPYKIFKISSKENIGIDELKEEMKGCVCALSGNSGVGKSTLINAIFEKDIMQEGKISEKLSRGKHTTRHAEIIEYEDFEIMDTPGFSMLDIEKISEKDLYNYFEEFIPYIEECEYRDCTHIKEENCGIKNAVKDGKISNVRYERYVEIYNEIKNIRRKI